MLHFSLFFICFSSSKTKLFYLGTSFLLETLGDCIFCSSIQPALDDSMGSDKDSQCNDNLNIHTTSMKFVAWNCQGVENEVY